MRNSSKTISLGLLLLLAFGASAEEQKLGIYQPHTQDWEIFTQESSPEVKALILQMFSSGNSRVGRGAGLDGNEISRRLNEPIVLPQVLDESPKGKSWEEQVPENRYDFELSSGQSVDRKFSDGSGNGLNIKRVLVITIKNVSREH